MPGLEDFTDAELRAMPDVVVVYRRHIPWGDAEIIDEPVDLCRHKFINFTLPRLRRDSRDLQAVSFIYQWIQAVPDEDLAAVRRRLDLERMVYFTLLQLA